MNGSICRWNIWHAKLSGEEIYFVWESFCSCLRYICLMASVVIHDWSNVPAGFSMWCPWCSILWSTVNHWFLPCFSICLGFNKNMHRFMSMPIDRDGVLIVGVHVDLLLISGAFCPTVGGGSIHINCKVPLWSDSRKSRLISLHFFICDNFGGLNVIWYPRFSYTF